jgi:hypothetical protein
VDSLNRREIGTSILKSRFAKSYRLKMPRIQVITAIYDQFLTIKNPLGMHAQRISIKQPYLSAKVPFMIDQCPGNEQKNT